MEKEYLIKKWLDNNLSEEESKAFQAMDNAELYVEIIQEAERFNGELSAKVKPLETIENKIFIKNTPVLNWLQIASRIAAIFIIGIPVFMLLDKDKINTYNTDYTQNETITLPDNSTVELNQLSQLKYNVSNWNEEKTLELKGEAFFDVEKGKRFDVNTKFGKISVFGTEFNVLSRDSVFKVSCYEGLVQVIYGNDRVLLPAGSEFTLKSGNSQKMNIVVSEPYWLKKMSVFENASIDNVIEELEKQFSINIINRFDKKDLMFTGAFEHNDLENALKSIAQPLNLTYVITNKKEVTISNVKN